MIDPKDEYQSLGDQAANLGQTMAKPWQQMLEGGELMVDDYEKQRRYNICEVCEHFVKHSKRCKKCGCYLKMKIQFKVSECPIKKW